MDEDLRLREVQKLSDFTKEFRSSIIEWIVDFCQNGEEHIGFDKLSNRLIENSYPEHIGNFIEIKELTSKIRESLRSLLSKAKREGYYAVNLSKNQYLFNLLCHYVYKNDFEYFRYHLYGKRLTRLANSFSALSNSKYDEYDTEYRDLNDISLIGLHSNIDNNEIFWDISPYSDGVYHLYQADVFKGDEGVNCELSFGIIVHQDGVNSCFLYNERKRHTYIYTISNSFLDLELKDRPKIKGLLARSSEDSENYVFEATDNYFVFEILSPLHEKYVSKVSEV